MRGQHCKAQVGYSVIELMVAIGVLLVVSSFAVLGWQGTYQNFKATSGLNDAIGQLRMARSLAISKRRNIEVAFGGSNQIQLTLETTTGVPAAPNPFLPETLASGVQFTLFAGLPDTPMAFGNSSALAFKAAGGAPAQPIHFTTSGALTDSNNNFVNGTIFLGIPGLKTTARAVTILGATGRVRPYYWDGTKWTE
jgi:type IV fimbrial biogenesis protein FimU